MSPRMTTRSAGRATTAPRVGRTGGRTGRGGGRTRGRSGDQCNGGIDGQGNQCSNQGNGRNQNGDAVNDNIQGDVRNVIVNNDRRGCTYKEFLACNPKEDNQKVKYTAGSFVGKALTWWNSQIYTRSPEAAVGMSWEDFKTLTRELDRLVPHLVTPENKRIERYIYGLALRIRGMVEATEPATIQRAV
ncbi:hypothetical protein Tco_0537164 [Tanacetum coccineum]